jgi:hypothetical protein
MGFLTPSARKFLWVEGVRNMKDEEILRELRNLTETIEKLREKGYNYQQLWSLEAKRRILEWFYYTLFRK